MAKELPYFKFEPNEWENGNIQMLSREDKGLFIDLCCMYWSRLGDLPYRLAIQKVCGGNANALNPLFEDDIISVDENDIIVISFLQEQLSEFTNISNQNSKNAKDGWEKRRKQKELSERNATAYDSQSESDAIRKDKRREDEIKEKNNIDSRKTSFANSIKPFLETYGKEMCTEFYKYWTEHGEKDKKMRFEKEKTFGIKQRLDRWKSNKSKFSTPTQKKDVLFVTPEGVEITDLHVLHVYQQTGKV
jgi:hypothetical protein